MSTCALRRDCTGAGVSNQRSTTRARAQHETGACGTDTSMYVNGCRAEMVEHRERGDALVAQRVERAEADLLEARARNRHRPARRRAPARAAELEHGARAADVDRADPGARCGGQLAHDVGRGRRREQRPTDRGTALHTEHLHRVARAPSSRARSPGRSTRRAPTCSPDMRHVRGGHVLGHRDAQRAREARAGRARARPTAAVRRGARSRRCRRTPARRRSCTPAARTISRGRSRAARP